MSAGPPILLVRVELEELPVSVVVAATAEDEQRLRLWLQSPGARRSIVDAIADCLDDLAGGERAA